jgi:hypothetical protein
LAEESKGKTKKRVVAKEAAKTTARKLGGTLKATARRSRAESDGSVLRETTKTLRITLGDAAKEPTVLRQRQSDLRTSQRCAWWVYRNRGVRPCVPIRASALSHWGRLNIRQPVHFFHDPRSPTSSCTPLTGSPMPR